MKILMISERFSPIVGGAEKQCLLLSSQLFKEGFDIDIVTRRIKKETAVKEKIKGLNVFRIGIPGLTRLSDYVCAFALAIFIIKNKDNYKIFHIHGGMANLFGSTAIILGKILGIPSLAKVATPGEFSFKGKASLQEKKFIHPLIKFRVFWSKKADFYIAQTRAIEKELLKLGIKASKVFLQPNGVDVTKFVSMDAGKIKKKFKKYDLDDKKIVFLYIGRIVARKGLLEFAKIWKELVGLNKNLVWLVVGSGKDQNDSIEKDLKKWVLENKLSDSIIFLGEHKRIEPFLSVADIFVYPSIHPEGIANSIIEAMAFGLPVLATNVGGINEIVDNGKNGYLANDVDELFKYAKTMIDSGDTRKNLGKMARKTVIQKFEISSVVKNYSKIYESILEK